MKNLSVTDVVIGTVGLMVFAVIAAVLVIITTFEVLADFIITRIKRRKRSR